MGAEVPTAEEVVMEAEEKTGASVGAAWASVASGEVMVLQDAWLAAVERGAVTFPTNWSTLMPCLAGWLYLKCA